jgi:hypothetical protein
MTADLYLKQGLAALARAHRINAMAGHLGAALLAGHLLKQEGPELTPPVCAGIDRELARVVAGESVFGPKAAAPIDNAALFAPYPDHVPAPPDAAGGIAKALASNIDGLRASGHNVIFAALGLRALAHDPDEGSPDVVAGIIALMETFDTTGAGYARLGTDQELVRAETVNLDEDDGIPPYGTLAGMVDAVLDQLIATAHRRKQGVGGLWHVINHAAALVDLDDLGYGDLARRGLRAHRRHLRIWAALPVLGEETPVVHNPYTAAYWANPDLERGRAKLTHRVKTLYGFRRLSYVLSGAPEQQTLARQRLRHLM